MNELAAALKKDFNAELSGEFVRRACYYPKIDCIEYLSSNEIAISERVDEFLTLIWNEEFSNIIGFKLKGFRFVFNKILKPLREVRDEDFNLIVEAFEHILTQFGDGMFKQSEKDASISEKRKGAYKNVIKFAKEEKVSLNEDDLREISNAA